MTEEAGGKAILLIDDHPESATALCELLKLLGHRVAVARTGEEGLRKIHELSPEVVLCDWRLPGMNGREVVLAVRADPDIASTYMVSLTGLDDDETKRLALASGFDLHLIKPPDLHELESLLADPAPLRH